MPRILSITDLESGVGSLLRLEAVPVPWPRCPLGQGFPSEMMGPNTVRNTCNDRLYTLEYSADGSPSLRSAGVWVKPESVSYSSVHTDRALYSMPYVSPYIRDVSPDVMVKPHDAGDWRRVTPMHGPVLCDATNLFNVNGRIFRDSRHYTQLWLYDPDSEEWQRLGTKPEGILPGRRIYMRPFVLGDSVVLFISMRRRSRCQRIRRPQTAGGRNQTRNPTALMGMERGGIW
ncbi:hypothetical protein KIPB_004414 [Kipferlia bialata]|uniref:Uncharacterized protein n=1 Tax=Kipferlia bialata TaxID=797122 RepID=A0A9K3GHF9_9EUKA|nr:hypothetical protein KIPB_004414 [Kipferlia bialata]|eukprot:g4414.t1